MCKGLGVRVPTDVMPRVRCLQVGVVERRSEEQSPRLETLPRSLPQAVSRASFASTAPTPTSCQLGGETWSGGASAPAAS
jgi:hypothetical protein